MCDLQASPHPSPAGFFISQSGDLGLLNLLCLSPHFIFPPPVSTPAQKAETYAKCSDEAMQENQTSVFNIDDRLACGEFSHPPKQAPFLLKTTGTGGYLCLAFPIESQNRQCNGFSERNKERAPNSGMGGREGDREGEWAFQQLVQKDVEQMAAIKCVCLCVCAREWKRERERTSMYACRSVHTHACEPANK